MCAGSDTAPNEAPHVEAPCWQVTRRGVRWEGSRERGMSRSPTTAASRFVQISRCLCLWGGGARKFRGSRLSFATSALEIASVRSRRVSCVVSLCACSLATHSHTLKLSFAEIIMASGCEDGLSKTRLG